jgi:isoleucyl-tRNA synthetase
VARFQRVDPKVDLPALEREILAFWRDARIFEKSLELRTGAPKWVFYEGPPTANGRPGIQHAESRTFKDVYPRFRTMTGYHVPRKAGWDCHGLPVELEIEKEIGTRTKRDIEEFGIAEFNRRCRESVTRYVEDWEQVTERLGFWIDLSQAYWTMDTEYIESVWWSLKELHRKGLMYEAHRSVAYCPRCGTALSDHEVAMGYTTVTDPSVFVKFPVTGPTRPELTGASFVAWTTTPWTLLANLGLAVSEEEEYVVAEHRGEHLVVAERLIEPVLGHDARIITSLVGRSLVGTRYAPPYPNVDDADVHRVVAGDFVGMDEGTGIVHIAPGFGPEDLEVGHREGWPVYRPIDDDGRFTDETSVELVRGRTVKAADPDIIEDLRQRGVLVRAETYEHTYPLCWRCDTPLLYMARTSWYIRTTARKERLLQVNESVSWFPDHIKHGRFGDWLENNVDWALSRERYWGTPLPVWRCDGGHVTVVGSLRELSELVGSDVTGVDPHRPSIDGVTFSCRECGEESRRVPEVIDAWYDSGAMPFAQWGYHPDLGRGREEFEGSFPADFISEAVDQTRGWFYSLMAEGVLLFDDAAYRNCVVLGLILAADGRRMSTRLGNAIHPAELLDRFGADALRWFMVTVGSPWSERRVSFDAVGAVVRQVLLTLWNVFSFYLTYANADDIDPTDGVVPVDERPVLDRWILSRLSAVVTAARRGLDAYDATGAARHIARFIDDLSNWYVRRSRRRFWDPARAGERAGADKVAAHQTLYECLTTVARLMAPLTPFVAEALWRTLAAGRDGAPESVHLSDYPEADRAVPDPDLERAMEVARRAASVGRTVRTDGRVRVRQPLARAAVHVPTDSGDLEPLANLIAEELNVKSVDLSDSAEIAGRWRARPSFRTLGPRLGGEVKEVALALQHDDGSVARELAEGRTVRLVTSGGEIEVAPEDVELFRETAGGWGVAADGGVTVALDLEVTPELAREGLARELVRLVQDARKAAGLEVTDRISLTVDGDDEVRGAVEAHREWIAGEVLATELTWGRSPADGHMEGHDVDGRSVTVTVSRA